MSDEEADMCDPTPSVRRCVQCEGPAHLCEQPDSTCRLKNRAREWLAAGHMGIYCDDLDQKLLDADARQLAPLVRQVEDGAWERLSVARTKEIERLTARIAELERENANLRKHIEDDSYCAEHGQQQCIECEDRCESCGYDALDEDMITTEKGERLCSDCHAVDLENAE